ncbi:N-acetylmuramoyl-L-alanine amidase [Candidatus Parcubacteria bacterium]|nr:N-acetylmuramoyl-L-alanine amidase [Candidatus Parcubacteria bacterium]
MRRIITGVAGGFGIAALFFVSACDAAEFTVRSQPITWGFRKVEMPRTIDTVVIHTLYNPWVKDWFSRPAVLRILKHYGVAPHYLITRDGTTLQLVAEDDVAFHAGRGRLPGTDQTEDLNIRSIGIELVSSRRTNPTAAQYRSLAALVRAISNRYQIAHIVGHRDVAPASRTDPWNFDWKKFRAMIAPP